MPARATPLFNDPRASEVVTCERLQLGDNVSLAYGRRGECGTPVLFLMGMGVAGHAWRNYIVGLADRHRTTWIDNRGAGATRAPAGLYSMKLLADDALRLLDHLGFEAAHVVGVSMGGMIAQHLALAAPARVRSLSLIVSHAGGTRARVPQLRGIRRLLLRDDVGDAPARMPALQRLLYPSEYLAGVDRDALQRLLQRDFVPTPLRYWLSQIVAMWRHDTRARLGELAGLPTLVVKAPHDMLIAPRQSDALARLIPGARLVELPDAGHGILRQSTEQLLAVLREHLARVDRRADDTNGDTDLSGGKARLSSSP